MHFHKAAAELVRRVDTGQNLSEELVVGAKAEFMTAARAVVTAIVKMREKT